jgi:hypothetical protein
MCSSGGGKQALTVADCELLSGRRGNGLVGWGLSGMGMGMVERHKWDWDADTSKREKRRRSVGARCHLDLELAAASRAARRDDFARQRPDTPVREYSSARATSAHDLRSRICPHLHRTWPHQSSPLSRDHICAGPAHACARASHICRRTLQRLAHRFFRGSQARVR